MSTIENQRCIVEPKDWPEGRKSRIVSTAILLIFNSTMGSSLPTMLTPYMVEAWGRWRSAAFLQSALPISSYMMGYVVGPVIWGPCSEHFGRRPVTRISTFSFVAWSLVASIAPNWTVFLLFRFLAGASASAPVAVVAGILSDLYKNPQQRGRITHYFLIANGRFWAAVGTYCLSKEPDSTNNGSMANTVKGLCSTSIGWRWTFWIGLICAAASVIPVIWLPETNMQVLQLDETRQSREGTPRFAAGEVTQFVKVVLARPLHMLFTEFIVAVTCGYLALCYAVFYMSFQLFPPIFQTFYGLGPRMTGVCFLPVGGGYLLSLMITAKYDAKLNSLRVQNSSWAKREEMRRLPLACIGGPMLSGSLFWLGWTTKQSIPYVVPMLAGVPFGCGFMLIFAALLNYLSDAYGVFAASASAAASFARSVFAALLPFAASPLLQHLGISRACSLLGSVAALMSLIPFFIIWKGEVIRSRSKLFNSLEG